MNDLSVKRRRVLGIMKSPADARAARRKRLSVQRLQSSSMQDGAVVDIKHQHRRFVLNTTGDKQPVKLLQLIQDERKHVVMHDTAAWQLHLAPNCRVDIVLPA